MSAEAKADTPTEAEVPTSSQLIGNTNVVSRFSSTEDAVRIGNLPPSPFLNKHAKDSLIRVFNKIGYTDFKVYEVFRIEIYPKQDYTPPVDIELTEAEQRIVSVIIQKRDEYERLGWYKERSDIKI